MDTTEPACCDTGRGVGTSGVGFEAAGTTVVLTSLSAIGESTFECV